MTITLNGTTGITTPAVTNNGAYTGDGISFADNTPSNTLVTDTSGNVGIGTASPISNGGYGGLSLNGTNGALFSLITNGTESGRIASIGNETSVQCKASTGYITFVQGVSGGTERMRIDSSGNLLVGATATAPYFDGKINSFGSGSVPAACFKGEGGGGQFVSSMLNTASSGTRNLLQFVVTATTQVGLISSNGTSTTYGTSSDYRLKENIVPMTGALAVVGQLKPCTYTWKETGENGQGFIAHELQEVVPDAVVGEKDAVNEDGSIKPQGIDTSFLVATLTAAIQELKAELDTVKTELATLKGTA